MVRELCRGERGAEGADGEVPGAGQGVWPGGLGPRGFRLRGVLQGARFDPGDAPLRGVPPGGREAGVPDEGVRAGEGGAGVRRVRRGGLREPGAPGGDEGRSPGGGAHGED